MGGNKYHGSQWVVVEGMKNNTNSSSVFSCRYRVELRDLGHGHAE